MSNKGDMPAFPNAHTDSNMEWVNGMTLRQWYKGQALAGLLANPGGPIQANGMSGWGFTNCKLEDVVGLVGSLADAMLEAEK